MSSVEQLDLSQVNQSSCAYYEGSADEIYRRIWGQSMHLGLFEKPDDSLSVAMQRTKDRIIDGIALHPDSRVLEVGCGFGALARQIATTFKCPVLATNISHKQLAHASELTAAQGLSDLVRFEYADFHHLPYGDDSFEVYWSQESFLHGVDKPRVLEEAHRVLEPFGLLIFSEVTLARATPPSLRDQILKRVHCPQMWSRHDYEVNLAKSGFAIEKWRDWSEHVPLNYTWAMDEMRVQEKELVEKIGQEAFDCALSGMALWQKAAEDGYLGWIHVVAAAIHRD